MILVRKENSDDMGAQWIRAVAKASLDQVAPEASADLLAQSDTIRQRMFELLNQARERGRLVQALDIDHVVLAARALVYGLARMAIDGHFPRWHPSEPPAQAMQHALGLFMGQIAAPPAA